MEFYFRHICFRRHKPRHDKTRNTILQGSTGLRNLRNKNISHSLCALRTFCACAHFSICTNLLEKMVCDWSHVPSNLLILEYGGLCKTGSNINRCGLGWRWNVRRLYVENEPSAVYNFSRILDGTGILLDFWLYSDDDFFNKRAVTL